MKELFLVIIVIASFAFIGGSNERYQAAGFDKKVFVLDKTTGEAWVSIHIPGAQYKQPGIELVPVEYSSYQWQTQDYFPDDTRNAEFVDFITGIQKKMKYEKRKSLESGNKLPT